MRVAVASFEYEPNNLFLIVERREDFARIGIFEGNAILHTIKGKDFALTGGVHAPRTTGVGIIPIFAAKRGAGGHVKDGFFAEASARSWRASQHACWWMASTSPCTAP